MNAIVIPQRNLVSEFNLATGVLCKQWETMWSECVIVSFTKS